MKKKLTLGEERILCGVCSGWAEYLEIDITITRMLYILFSLLIGIEPMIIIYFISYLLIPNKI